MTQTTTFIKDDAPVAYDIANNENEKIKKEKKKYGEQEKRERWDGPSN